MVFLESPGVYMKMSDIVHGMLVDSARLDLFPLLKKTHVYCTI